MKMNFKKLVYSAVFAALACVCTMMIRIPTPGTSGYIHPGDAVVILSGVFLGPVYGGLAAGIGSMLADFFGGYMIYVPMTFAFKFGIAFTTGLIYRKLIATRKSRQLAIFLGGIMDIIFVVGAYTIVEIPLYTLAGALASVPAKFVQSIGGLVLASVLFPVLHAIPELNKMSTESAKIKKAETAEK